MNALFGIMTGSTVESSVALGPSATKGGPMRLNRTDPRHFATGGGVAPLGEEPKATFEGAMLKALDGVNADQAASTNAIEAMLVDPESIDAHDVTVAMAKANMSLNIARTVLSRVVTAWKDIINTR